VPLELHPFGPAQVNVQVDVVLGPARAGKTHDLLLRYLEALRTTPITPAGRCLWIAPTSRGAATVRDALATHGNTFLAPGITTFEDLAQQILFAANRKTRPISRVIQRELLRRTVRRALDADRLRFFAAAARRPGFIDLLLEHIRELRQRDIRPEAYERVAATRGQPIERRELALLYSDYDRQLTEHNLCDVEGLQWVARDALTHDACGHFAKLAVVVVDGFTDFTRMQMELLRLLAGRADKLSISLPMDAPPEAGSPKVGRSDLFAKTTATLAELKQQYPQLKEHRLHARPSENHALDHIAQNLFRYPHDEPTSNTIDSLSRVDIIEAASAQDEITQLARRIKQLLVPLPYRERQREGSAQSSVFPNDILVIFRSLADVAPRIEETFAHHGIPFSLDSSPRIAGSPFFRTLISLLQLDSENWPFRAVISVITNNLLSAIAEPARRSADWLIRDLQLASGHDALLEALTRLATPPTDTDEVSDRHRRRIASAAEALPAVQLLADSFAQLRLEATPTEWSAALEVFSLRLGLAPSSNSTDLPAWQSIVAHLATVERLDQWLEQPVRKLTRSDLLALLTDIGSHEPLPRPRDEAGRIRIVSAQSARGISARHVFLAGMSEQSFPAGAGSARLADDKDYRFLTNAAHQLESPTAAAHSAAVRSQDEMLLFYEVITRAQDSLTISYPAMDEKAQELPPSPYVVELKRLFRNAKRSIHCTRPQLSPVPPQDSISSISDWRIAALAEAAGTDGNLRLLAGLISEPSTKPLAQAIDAGVRIIHARARGESFGPAEGVLISPAITARLAQRFGAKHSWSPSQFETYAACPYKFFLQDVLGLEPLGDLTLETDFARRGSLLHHVLATFHRKYGESSTAWSALWRDEARFSTEIKQALQAAIDATPREGIDAALLELDRRQIDKWTDLYRGQHEKYNGAWSKLDEPPRPAHFELRFGRKHPGERGYEDPRSADDAFKLNIGGEVVNIVGRIDRIDVGRAGDQTVFNVIDYKSGRRPTLTPEKIESGERLQPALYVMAAQALVFGDDKSAPLWTGYWSMQGGVTTDKRYSLHCAVENGKPSDHWTDLQQKVIARIAEIVHATRRGDFQVDSRDPHCTSFCDFKTICRIAQARTTNKIPPPIEPTGARQ
jgi:ATP-dependent helicase/nuclease subunit B